MRPDDDTVVFVVDDTEDMRALVCAMLTKLGYAPIAFSNGDDCLDAIAIQKPAAVLMDLHMPLRSGDDCCRQIKEDPKSTHVPVIMLTAADAPHEVMMGW